MMGNLSENDELVEKLTKEGYKAYSVYLGILDGNQEPAPRFEKLPFKMQAALQAFTRNILDGINARTAEPVEGE